jgi:hypothetical protein
MMAASLQVALGSLSWARARDPARRCLFSPSSRHSISALNSPRSLWSRAQALSAQDSNSERHREKSGGQSFGKAPRGGGGKSAKATANARAVTKREKGETAFFWQKRAAAAAGNVRDHRGPSAVAMSRLRMSLFGARDARDAAPAAAGAEGPSSTTAAPAAPQVELASEGEVTRTVAVGADVPAIDDFFADDFTALVPRFAFDNLTVGTPYKLANPADP